MAYHLKDEDILIVLTGSAKVSNRKFKEVFGQKAKMITPDRLIEVTGHPVGGVCPFGLANPLTIYLDSSLTRYQTVFPAAGARNSAVEMRVDQLADMTEGRWIDVSEMSC
jgi:prolyl-tRNA editing enzyme YbaK/EbsC (Cys-tRNA(Pro) deacylase)